MATKVEDKDVTQFEQDLLQSIDEMKRGQYVAVHTPEQIAARKRGRPAQEITKVLTTIRFDADVLQALKATGTGWQTRANDALRAHLKLKRPARRASTARATAAKP